MDPGQSVAELTQFLGNSVQLDIPIRRCGWISFVYMPSQSPNAQNLHGIACISRPSGQGRDGHNFRRVPFSWFIKKSNSEVPPPKDVEYMHRVHRIHTFTRSTAYMHGGTCMIFEKRLTLVHCGVGHDI